jgi:outer membrane protein OmpU
MKKILIATTALVATAGMASADITITGSANAGYYSGLSNKDGAAAVTAATTTSGSFAYIDADGASATSGAEQSSVKHIANGTAAVTLATGDTVLQGTNGVPTSAASVGTYTDAGIYSNAGIVATMTGATDGGITFSASVDAEAGTEVDTGDFELDGVDANAVSFGSLSMTGTFGTLTFDDGGIDNLYDDDNSAADLSYSTTVGAVSLTIAHNTAAVDDANSMSAGYSASGMTFALTASEDTAGTSTALSVAYALNDTVSLTGSTDQAAGVESVQTIGATTTLNGVSVSVSSANDSTWDVDLGYTAGGFALTYGVDETDGWTATATSALGGGATFAAGVSSDDEMYAGVSFAF